MSVPNSIPLGPMVSTLGLLLATSLVVERSLNIMKWALDRFLLLKKNKPKLCTDLKHMERAHSESLLLESQEVHSNDDHGEILSSPIYANNKSSAFRFGIKSLPSIDEAVVLKEFWLQMAGFAIALTICHYSKLSIWPFFEWLQNANKPFHSLDSNSSWIASIITAIVIGAGSKPIHFLMTFLIERKFTTPTTDSTSKEVVTIQDKENNPVFIPDTPHLHLKSIEELIGFQYDGGDRPNRLEHTHIRNKKIDMLVYHHTTLHSNASFQELVREFDHKGWLTGYHAVVFADGSIRVLCRWDRIGNHAVGYNSHSLGLAFQGCFETNAKIPNSNVNGKLGIDSPTDLQLQAGARVLALWAHLHSVPIDFQKNIIPHNAIAAKACPGSGFPIDGFTKLVASYFDAWQNESWFQESLQAFRKKAMVI